MDFCVQNVGIQISVRERVIFQEDAQGVKKMNQQHLILFFTGARSQLIWRWRLPILCVMLLTFRHMKLADS